MVGWYFDVVSNKFTRNQRVFIWLALILCTVTVAVGLTETLFPAWDRSSMSLFLLGLPVMLHTKGSYLLTVGSTNHMRTDGEKVKAELDARIGRTRKEVIWNLLGLLAFFLLLAGIYFIGVPNYVNAAMFLLPAIILIGISVHIYVLDRKEKEERRRTLGARTT